MNTSTSKRVAILEAVTHYLTALVVLLKGIDKLDAGKMFFGMFFVAVGLFIVFGTIFHHRFERALRNFKGYVFLLESIVSIMVGYVYLKDGKNFIQYIFFAAALMFLIAAIIHFRKTKSSPSHH